MKINKKGFTLIELIIVVGIMILLMGGSLATFNTFNDQKNIEAEGKKFASFIDLIKKKAISGDTTECAGTIQDYRITYDQDTYTLQVDCDSVINTIHTYKLPQKVTFKTADTIIFPFKESGTTSTVSPIIISNSDSTKCFKLTVYSTGVVDELGPSQAACN